MSAATDEFVRSNEERFLEELKDFLRIPSISTLPEHRGDIDRAAQFVASQLRAAGLDWLHAPGKPVVRPLRCAAD